MRRKQILMLFKALRSACPHSNSVCSSVSLRRTNSRGDVDQEEFELHLYWVPDETSRIFLKKYVSMHNLSLKETEKSVTVYNAENQSLKNQPSFLLKQNQIYPKVS